MRKSKKPATLLKKAAILLFALPLGVLIGFFFRIGMMLDITEVLHQERLSCLKKKGKIIIACNHPSLGDPFFIAALLLEYFAYYPLRCAPLIVADRLNFFDCWWFWPFRSVMVPVDRTSSAKKSASLIRIKEAVESGRPLVIFVEGGRTSSGKSGEFHYSQMGNIIRFLQGGFALLVRATGADILPMGIKGSDKAFPNCNKGLRTRFVPFEKVVIAVGEPIRFDKSANKMRMVQVVGSRILSLMDEASAV